MFSTILVKLLMTTMGYGHQYIYGLVFTQPIYYVNILLLENSMDFLLLTFFFFFNKYLMIFFKSTYSLQKLIVRYVCKDIVMKKVITPRKALIIW